MDKNSTVERLDAIVQAEREALISGDFDRIAELFDEKQALITEIEDAPIDRDGLAPIHEGLRRNQELFDQALAGIRNVANRLGDVHQLRRVMNTYDAHGRAQTIDAPTAPILERRA